MRSAAHLPILCGLVLVVVLVAGCAGDPRTPPTLYTRLGGAANVAQVMQRAIERAATDPRTRRTFDGVKLKHVQDSLAQQVCAITGGGCTYEGDPMVDVHRGLHITASEFDALVTILREELDRSGTDAAAKNQLLRLLAPMRRDIVG